MDEEKLNSNNSNFKMTTEEAIRLIDIIKERISEETLEFPSIGTKLEFDVLARREDTKFIVSIRRGKIDKKKCTYQGRTYFNNIPLLRLDITNSFHINSDGTKIKGNHLHIYNEITEMRDAVPFNIKNADLYECCLEFFKKFNIIQDNVGILYQMSVEEEI